MSEQTKPRVFLATTLICECGRALLPLTTRFDLRVSNVIEGICIDNPECKYHDKVIGIKLVELEVVYMKEGKHVGAIAE